MFKILASATILAGGLLTATTLQAREISVWGNNFTVQDGADAAGPAPIAPRFNATVEHPDRFMRRHRRLDNLN